MRGAFSNVICGKFVAGVLIEEIEETEDNHKMRLVCKKQEKPPKKRNGKK